MTNIKERSGARLTRLWPEDGLPSGLKLVVAAVVGALMTLLVGSFYERHFVLQDDTDLGAEYASVLQGQQGIDLGRHAGNLPRLCELAAEALYGHRMFEYEYGYAPRAEKAFYNGCSGIAVGGVGGTGD